MKSTAYSYYAFDRARNTQHSYLEFQDLNTEKCKVLVRSEKHAKSPVILVIYANENLCTELDVEMARKLRSALSAFIKDEGGH